MWWPRFSVFISTPFHLFCFSSACVIFISNCKELLFNRSPVFQIYLGHACVSSSLVKLFWNNCQFCCRFAHSGLCGAALCLGYNGDPSHGVCGFCEQRSELRFLDGVVGSNERSWIRNACVGRAGEFHLAMITSITFENKTRDRRFTKACGTIDDCVSKFFHCYFSLKKRFFNYTHYIQTKSGIIVFWSLKLVEGLIICHCGLKDLIRHHICALFLLFF